MRSSFGKLLICLALIGGLCTAAPVRAGGLIQEIKIGVLAHDIPGLWSGIRMEPADAAFNAEIVLRPSIPLLGGVIRPALGGSFTSDNSTSNIYLDARWQYEMFAGLYLGLGLGVAVHNGQVDWREFALKPLGTRFLFHVPIEVGLRLTPRTSISAYFEHISNGYTSGLNPGLDRAGVRYGYRF